MTSTPTYAEFVVGFPAFQDTPRGQVEQQLTLSSSLLDPSVWVELYAQGVYLDAAHNLSLDGLGAQNAFQGTAGPVSSVSAGGMSTSFQSVNFNNESMTETWYSKTIYGQQLLRLWRTIAPLGMVCG